MVGKNNKNDKNIPPNLVEFNGDEYFPLGSASMHQRSDTLLIGSGISQ